MEMIIKMSSTITLILAAIMNLVINFFTNDLLNAKNNVTVYEGHVNFRKEATKKFTTCRIKLYVKNITFRLLQLQS